MSDDEHDIEFDRAYREFLRGRFSDVYVEDLGPEQFEQWGQLITRLLRRFGNVPLADRYDAAFADMQRLLLTDGVSDPTSNAPEHFERVQIEALAWLHQRTDGDDS